MKLSKDVGGQSPLVLRTREMAQQLPMSIALLQSSTWQGDRVSRGELMRNAICALLLTHHAPQTLFSLRYRN